MTRFKPVTDADREERILQIAKSMTMVVLYPNIRDLLSEESIGAINLAISLILRDLNPGNDGAFSA